MTHGNESLLEQIETYFQFNDDDFTFNDDDNSSIDTNNDNQIPTLDVLSQKFTAYQTQVRSTVPVDKLLEVYESANQFLKEWDWLDTELDQKVCASLFNDENICLVQFVV
jgi:hypothetical protein